jgi:UDP-N-acetylmuramoylalanine--D-glutamate ligase
MDVAGRRVVVLGLAHSGRAACALLRDRGADVVGLDLRTDVAAIEGVRLELGPHRRETFLGADLVVTSPGVPSAQPDLVAARSAGVPVVGEVALAWAFADPRVKDRCVGVTGTNGKSTVTWFTGQLLAAAGMKPFVGGNLGRPLSEAVGGDFDAAAVEVSSYQLEAAGDFRPRAGVILNLTPDHLARHGTMEGYAAAKARLFAHMGPDDLAVIPHDPLLEAACGSTGGRRAWLGDLPGVVRVGRTARVRLPSGLDVELDLGGVKVPGEHNLDNAATAALLALAVGAGVASVQAGLGALTALAHRMEVVGEHDGVLWINDSKATNVDAARVGLSGLDRPAVVLLGGEAKGRGFVELAPALRRQRAVVCFGGSGPAIADELASVGIEAVRVPWLADAVTVAAELARPGDVVLLSPGCASFDEFQNFEHRGRAFRELVARRSE